MKKLFIILTLLALTVFVKAQTTYPQKQSLGNANTLVQVPANGGMQAVLVPQAFTDTTAANAVNYVKYTAGAIIRTTSDGKVWKRNEAKTKWDEGTGSVDISSFYFTADSSIIICYGSGVCDTVSVGGTTNITTNIYNNSVVNSYLYNDSLLIICTGAGVCDTVNLGDSYASFYFINDSTVVACDSGQVVCVGDVCHTEQTCDTINVGHQNINLDQNWVTSPAQGIHEVGGYLKHYTPLYTNYQHVDILSNTIGHEPLSIENYQYAGVQSSLIRFKNGGSSIVGTPDYTDRASVYLNYATKTYPTGNKGVFGGDTLGYYFITNARSLGNYALQMDVAYAKLTGILFHTQDTQNTAGVTIFAKQGANIQSYANPQGTGDYLSQNRIAEFRTNGSVNFPQYTTSNFNGGSSSDSVMVITSTGDIKKRSPSAFGSTYTASNGLTLSGSDFKLGGTFTGNTTLATAAFGLIISTSTGGVTPLTVTSGTGNAFYASSDNIAGTFDSYGGNSIYANNYTHNAFTALLRQNTVNTNTASNMFSLRRETTGTAANGIGSIIDFTTQMVSGSLATANQITSKLTDATDATVTSQFIVSGVNSGTPTDLAYFNGNGTMRWPQYGAGTLTTDGSGNITATSDKRIKHDIKPMTYGLSSIMKLEPSTFIYNNDSSNTVMPGFIAQNVSTAFNGLGVGKDKSGYLTLNNNVVIAGLVNGMKEQQKTIESLTKRIEQLEKKGNGNGHN